MIEINYLIFQYLINQQLIYLLKIHHIATNNTTTQLSQQLVILTALPPLPHHLLQILLILQLPDLQIYQIHLFHSSRIAHLENSRRFVRLSDYISLGWLVVVRLLYEIFIEILLHASRLALFPLLLATFFLIVAEDGIEFGWVKHRIFNSHLFLMLLLDMIVLIHKVIYSHISSQINRWQLCLHIDFLCQSFKIMAALFGIE